MKSLCIAFVAVFGVPFGALVLLVGCDSHQGGFDAEDLSEPLNYEIEVTERDLEGFWILTKQSRDALEDYAENYRELQKVEEGDLLIEPAAVEGFSYLMVFAIQPSHSGMSREEYQNPKQIGLIEKHPFSGAIYGSKASFEWVLNLDGDVPSSMIAVKDHKIQEAVQWVDLCYEKSPSMPTYFRYYIAKRGDSLRLLKRFESYTLEWGQLGERVIAEDAKRQAREAQEWSDKRGG